jgi:hypothetical protein
MYPLYRKWFGDYQDIAHSAYKEMTGPIVKLMESNRGSIYVSGHEHALQYVDQGGSHFVVSGSGAKTSFVKKKEYSRFAMAVKGFVKLKIHEDGFIDVGFWQVDKNFKMGKEIFRDSIPYGSN